MEKKHSRQYAYQLRQKKKGLCWKCGKPVETGKSMCRFHLLKERDRMRVRYVRTSKE